MRTLSGFLFASLLMACGSPQPMTPPPTVDSGQMMVTDATPPSDHPVPTDTPTPPEDRMTVPVDVEPVVCIPMEGMTCNSARLCQPNSWNPTCMGATACQCDTSEASMPATCRASSSMMQSCRESMTCMPGANHCSVDLPAGVNYAPFTFDEQFFRNRAYNLRYWYEMGGMRGTTYSWYSSTEEALYFAQNTSTRNEDENGFRLINIATPDSLHNLVTGATIVTTCSGNSCYWNRSSSMSSGSPSIEITFASPCSLTLRVFGAGGTTLQEPTTFTARRPGC